MTQLDLDLDVQDVDLIKLFRESDFIRFTTFLDWHEASSEAAPNATEEHL